MLTETARKPVSTGRLDRKNIPIVQTSAGNFVHLPIADVGVDPHQPRRHFDAVKLEELAASITAHGIIEPIIVRAAPNTSATLPKFIIIAGERRWRAAQLAKKETIPALVRQLSDEDTLELQIIENLQREGLLPLEEAYGYARLMKEHNYTADQVAAKIGKSRRYVFARIQLTKLAPAVVKALGTGTLDASAALLFARIPVPALQEQALAEYLKPSEFGEGLLSIRDLEEELRQKYTLDLAKAPFNTAEITLVPAAGACTTCAMRTGNSPDRYPEIKGANVCTDPDCFAAKREAAWAQVAVHAKKVGKRVLTAKQSAGLFKWGNTSLTDHNFVELDTKPQGEKNRTYRELLGSAQGKIHKHPQVIVARDNQGQARELVTAHEAAAAIQQAGLKVKIDVPRQEPKQDDETRRQTKERQAAQLALRNQVAAEAIRLVMGHASKQKTLDAALWEVIASRVLDEEPRTIAKRKQTAADLQISVVNACLRPEYGDDLVDYNHDYTPQLKAACAHFGFDLKQLEKEAATKGVKK